MTRRVVGKQVGTAVRGHSVGYRYNPLRYYQGFYGCP